MDKLGTNKKKKRFQTQKLVESQNVQTFVSPLSKLGISFEQFLFISSALPLPREFSRVSAKIGQAASVFSSEGQLRPSRCRNRRTQPNCRSRERNKKKITRRPSRDFCCFIPTTCKIQIAPGDFSRLGDDAEKAPEIRPSITRLTHSLIDYREKPLLYSQLAFYVERKREIIEKLSLASRY